MSLPCSNSQIDLLASVLSESIETIPNILIKKEYAEFSTSIGSLTSIVVNRLENMPVSDLSLKEHIALALRVLYNTANTTDNATLTSEYTALYKSLTSVLGNARNILKHIHQEVVPDLMSRINSAVSDEMSKQYKDRSADTITNIDWEVTESDLDVLDATIQKVFGKTYVGALDKSVVWFKSVEISDEQDYIVPGEYRQTLYAQAAERGITSDSLDDYLNLFKNTSDILKRIHELIVGDDLLNLYRVCKSLITNYSKALTLTKVIFDADDAVLDIWSEFTAKTVDTILVANALLLSLREQFKINQIAGLGEGELLLNPDVAEELVSANITQNNIFYYWYTIFERDCRAGFTVEALRNANFDACKETYEKAIEDNTRRVVSSKQGIIHSAAERVVSEYVQRAMSLNNADGADKEALKNTVSSLLSRSTFLSELDLTEALTLICINTYEPKVAKVLSQIHYSIAEQFHKVMSLGVSEVDLDDTDRISTYAEARTISRFIINEMLEVVNS